MTKICPWFCNWYELLVFVLYFVFLWALCPTFNRLVFWDYWAMPFCFAIGQCLCWIIKQKNIISSIARLKTKTNKQNNQNHLLISLPSVLMWRSMTQEIATIVTILEIRRLLPIKPSEQQVPLCNSLEDEANCQFN